MRNRRFLHLLLFLISLISLCVAFFHFFNEEDKKCLGIDIISEKEISKYIYKYTDYSEKVLFYDESVAIDHKSRTIYIPQKIVEGTGKRELKGTLLLEDPESEMFFVEDEYFDNLFEATKMGHSFKLYIVNDYNQYMKYNVVFTTVSVLRMDGEFIYIDGNSRDVMLGEMCLWPSNFNDGEHNLVQKSALKWRIRGNSSSFEDKKPWKMSLKKDNDKNNDLNLLGLGADDDWILNPMNLDDLKVREKLFMDLWNEMQKVDNYNYPMSNGEYVELILNGKYYGLYLMQRRVDDKYLNLEDEDILLKGRQIYMPTNPEDYFEIKYSNLDSEETFKIAEENCLIGDATSYDMDNMIDLNLFVQFASASDNELYKNIYYILEKQANGEYKTFLLPWDTDISFGLDWEGDFFYDFDANINVDIERPELKIALDKKLIKESDFAERWKELSTNVLNADYVKGKIEFLEQYLINSGAYKRDNEIWGKRYNGEDTFESIYKFINKRIEFMNEKYK